MEEVEAEESLEAVEVEEVGDCLVEAVPVAPREEFSAPPRPRGQVWSSLNMMEIFSSIIDFRRGILLRWKCGLFGLRCAATKLAL